MSGIYTDEDDGVAAKMRNDDSSSCSSSKFEALQLKFNKLKEKREMITMESKQSVIPPTQVHGSTKSKMHSNDNEDVSKNEIASEAELLRTEINHYMPLSFTISAENDNKNSALKLELDEALKNKDYILSEKISEKMEKERLTTQIHGALAARKFMNEKKKKEIKKNKKKKLKWAFDQKERWETKSNM